MKKNDTYRRFGRRILGLGVQAAEIGTPKLPKYQRNVISHKKMAGIKSPSNFSAIY